MAFDNNQKEFPIPTNNKKEVRSTQFLPRFFRTPTNEKFLNSTLDQMIQPGVAEKLSGYIGRQAAKARTASDIYVGDVTKQRRDYQFEPASVMKDTLGNINFYKDYPDFVNQINAFKGNISNESILNSQEYYAWNPSIDWDKFTNFREYYWLPTGPQSIPVSGQSRQVVSTYSVTLSDQGDSLAYIFSPNGFTPNPTLKLYRGQKYRFDINTPNYPIAFATSRSFTPGDAILVATTEGILANGRYDDVLYDGAAYDVGAFVIAPDPGGVVPGETVNRSQIYNDGIVRYNDNLDEIAVVYVDDGIIEFTIPDNAPDKLYYISKNDVNVSGFVRIYDIEENTVIDVEAEIIGKKTYFTSSGFALSNGMKIYFQGDVTPEIYSTGEWYVEGVGDKIVLINTDDLEIPALYSEDIPVPFDTEPFDRLPFGNASSYAGTKDYVVINRASRDRNAWSRYNHWFHKEVIEKAAELNNQPVSVDQSLRAKRPIIEFEAGLKLYQFGSYAKNDVDLIDDYTTDVFSIIEGSLGYNVDGEPLTDGMRILFSADTDILVRNRIYQVRFVTFENRRQITLIETEDTYPQLNETVLIKRGNQYRGQIFYFDGTSWNRGQEKITVNQSPLFDLFDKNGISYSDSSVYPVTTFAGNKIFSYRRGTGTIDTELGFPLTYRAFENVGDIEFTFDLLNSTYDYAVEHTTVNIKSDISYLRKYTNRELFSYTNGWTKGRTLSNQKVIRLYIVGSQLNDFAVDVFDNSGDLNELDVIVYVNNVLKFELTDYFINRINGVAYIRFYHDLKETDVVILKCRSESAKNNNGYYEIPHNLEKNPLNNNMTHFTLGEINDHVMTIIEEAIEFNGIFPGTSNLRDLGEVDQYGKAFVKHSGPFNLTNYHITDKNDNIIKAIRFSRREYAKFKRVFLQTAFDLGYDGSVKEHVDLILKTMNKDKTNTMPFYFSDMLPCGPAKRLTFTVQFAEQIYFALTTSFSMSSISAKAVQVYLNGTQLVYGNDYTFNSDGFCIITTEKQINDIVDIYEYETTDGSFMPPSPTKLGLYPSFVPTIVNDDTYQTTTRMIQGHDGSLITVFDDYRDNLLLELELRIYNNLKQEYRTDILDINDFVGGEYRNTGFTRDSINDSIIYDFTQWLSIVGSVDYTDHNFHSRDNSFTFNYKFMTSPSGKMLPGFWRAVYKEAYDTDRPHSHPWEILGFKIKPTWWESVYGPAPYTKDNLILWTDLENGAIRDPNEDPVFNVKYARPGLTSHIPVDNQGNLLSPLDSNYAKGYVARYTSKEFTFGDEAPIETAWRRSSEFPFSLITAWILNQPAKICGIGFDLSRIERDIAGHIVYTPIQQQIRLDSLVFPNTAMGLSRISTSGLVNYIHNYLSSSVLLSYENYKDRLTNITNQLGAKIGGFTDKSKFQLILDSRTPFNQGNVLVPEENYQIFLNTSSPIEVVNYSGIIIEKTATGYSVKGYERNSPGFLYYRVHALNSDPTMVIGGVSSTYIDWDQNKQYLKGQIVRYNSTFYRVVGNHVSEDNFDFSKFIALQELPIEGGRRISIRKNFDKNTVKELPYGFVFHTIQEVADFIFGYEAYLIDKGFIFDYFEQDGGYVENWRHSIKEFAFWTTQNWNEGSVITLSPGASQIKFISKYSVVDNIFDNFYDYSLVKSDGKKLTEEFSSRTRNNQNEFILTPRDTRDGIYNVKLPLVQKEHILLLDNRTVFNDIIYDSEPGYRQERIRVIGYRSDNWSGGLNIPGFIYDEAHITEWEDNKDYDIGAIVKYKEFYYTANKRISGTNLFVASDWSILSEKPESKLRTNFDFKISEFSDFYDLDSDNFDAEQQKFAQHLIGYQKRQYLQNIINDDISQYKFYQGYITEKGTKNSLIRLFDALSAADKESLEFYEEWAIRVGQIGAVEKFEEYEYILRESDFKLTPQTVELTDYNNSNDTRLVYKVTRSDAYLTPIEYNHAPFPTSSSIVEVVKTAGYVNTEDTDYTILSYDEILNIDIKEITNGQYVWIGKHNHSWEILRYTNTPYKIRSIEQDGDFTIFNLNLSPDFADGEIIGIFDLSDELDGFYKIINTPGNAIKIESTDFDELSTTTAIITRFRSNRYASFDAANQILQERGVNENELIWIDNALNDTWNVFKKNDVFSKLQTIENTNSFDSTPDNFASSISATNNNNIVVIGAPDFGNGQVYVYTRSSDANQLAIRQTIDVPSNITGDYPRFGAAVEVSADGKYLLIGSPNASYVKTKFRGTYSTITDYNKNDIVEYKESLWKARLSLLGATDNILFSTFDYYEAISGLTDSSLINLLVLGNYGLLDTNADHILIRAPIDMYTGVAVGDTIYLKWNVYTNESGDASTEKQPFDNEITGIDDSTITGGHTVVEKIDHILYIDNWFNLPQVGDRVSTDAASGIIYYIDNLSSSLVMYLNELNGTFTETGQIYVDDTTFVGDYTIPDYTGGDGLGGYFYIEVDSYTTGAGPFVDEGRGLVFYDVVKAGEVRDVNFYINILDNINTIGTKTDLNDEVSFLSVLSYSGNPYDDDAISFFDTLDSRWVVRAPKSFSDTLTVGDEFQLYLTNTLVAETYGLTHEYLNSVHTIDDLWDGYIDFVFTEFQTADTDGDTLVGDPYEPVINDVVMDNSTGATAEVMFYVRQVNNIRIFIKNVTGTWSAGSNYSDSADIIRLGTPNRKMGVVTQVSLGSAEVGKLIVIDAGDNFEVPTIQNIIDEEYWFYYEITEVLGVPREPNIPASNNNDWIQVYNIQTDENGIASPYIDQGMYSVYERQKNGEYSYINSYVIRGAASFKYLGDRIRIRKQNDLYTAFISSLGTETIDGSIHFVLNGVREGITYDWEQGKDRNYRGEFDSSLFYFENEIVKYDNKLWIAITNVAAGLTFDDSDWEEITDNGVAYLGYIPNDPSVNINDDIFTPEGGITVFAYDFDVSEAGDVIVVSSKLQGNDSTKKSSIEVYRRSGDHFSIDQVIYAENNNTGFGESVTITNDGLILAIGEPYDSTKQYDQGKVHIYVQENGQFVHSQTLYSASNEEAERFGYQIDFDNDQLVVTSLNGDARTLTTFDNDVTSFDNYLTSFVKTNIDTGIVQIFERFENTLLYAGIFTFDDPSIIYFGENLVANGNHVYVGVPMINIKDEREGILVDYRKVRNSTNWARHRSPIDPVVINDIKSIFLYDKRKNEYLSSVDFIDPIQGKIAGIADQDISYKLYYDPAIYNYGNELVNVDEADHWAERFIGKVWWDLSTSLFVNPYQGDITYQSNNWNKLFPGATIDVYEWIETELLPSQWDAKADTDEGLSLGISGISKYGDDVYTVKRKYDSISQSFSNRYYFWVKNSVVIPNQEFRSINAFDIANLISNPFQQQYRYVAIHSNNKFSIANCDRFLKDNDTVINFQIWKLDNRDMNIHTQYQIITDGLETSRPKRDIEEKWFDSLIGVDRFDREIPDPYLSVKQKYGTLYRPRQSWFVNRIEILKQVIESINDTLLKNLIVDDFDLSSLDDKDPIPLEVENLYDQAIESIELLQFVGVSSVIRGVLNPVIEDGKIVRVDIIEKGYGYRYPPTYELIGNGDDAEFVIEIDGVGSISAVTVLNPGFGYDANTFLTVRRYSVLIESDSTLDGKWSIYRWNVELNLWERASSQKYDVSLYWDYADWYETGYNEFTQINYTIDEAYELTSLDDQIGDITKIRNIGTGGWLLLLKVDNQETIDYTINYETIGRENGTIQFSNSLYSSSSGGFGFDVENFDIDLYDNEPNTELRKILETIRDNIFVDNLAIEYNRLFFLCLRYVFSEQNYVDWAFKTSFIKARHNVGSLRQKATFQNDNLPSYEEYIKEVKPYKTKIREYLSTYDTKDDTNSITTDFDLQPYYNETSQKIVPHSVKIEDNTLVGVTNLIDTYPFKHWLDNHAYKVIEIKIKDSGENYLERPIITLVGGGGTGATARAYVGSGRIQKIEITNSGSGYTSAPLVVINGTQSAGSTIARASAIIGESPVRGFHNILKFDRVSQTYWITDINQIETFTGTGSKIKFDLTYPMDTRFNTITIYVNGIESLRSEYTYDNILNQDNGYDRYKGQIIFTTAPSIGDSVEIRYKKNVSMLTAQDRINFFYSPTTRMYGRDLAQLMDGIDYGGVEVRSFDFSGGAGWDANPWYVGAWDTYDNTFEDEIFTLDGSTILIELSAPLEVDVEYNLYKNGVRLDDEVYGDSTPTNPNAIMQTIIGDGVTQTIYLQDLGITTEVDDVIVIRKSTSDGSFLPDPESYDTLLQGGDLAYSTAKGIGADQIVVDGDGFVTPMTSKGPEELVPGQLLDTLDIRVYDKVGDGSSNIYVGNYVSDGVTKTYQLGIRPNSNEAIFVIVEDLKTTDFVIDWANLTLTFNTAPVINNEISIIVMGEAGEQVLDVGTIEADGSTSTFSTKARFSSTILYNIQIDGVLTNAVISSNVSRHEIQLIGDGETTSFDLPYNLTSNFEIFIDGVAQFSQFYQIQTEKDEFNNDIWKLVFLNGVPAEGAIILIYDSVENVDFTISPAPEIGSTIRYVIYESSNTMFSIVTKDLFIGDGSTVEFTLAQAPFTATPARWRTLVRVDGIFKNPGYNREFTVSSAREYFIDSWQQPNGTIDSSEVIAYLNGELIQQTVKYRWDTFNSSVVLFDGIGQTGDTLQVFIIGDGDYELSNNTLTLDVAPGSSQEVEVFQFSNHDVLDIDRIVYEVIARETITVGTSAYSTYQHLTNGLIKLRDTIFDAQYVWVFVNGEMLSPSVDYYVTDDQRHVKIVNDLSEGDVVDLMHFTAPRTTDSYGFRIFKDMLNRTHYKRLDDTNTFMLARDLNWYDLRIYLTDATNMAEPNKEKNLPGVVFINGERIEYFVKDGNTLRQLRRGTLGTGVGSKYLAGSRIYDQGMEQTIPYKDRIMTQVFVSDGTTNNFELDFVPTSVNDFEVFVGGTRLRKNSISMFNPLTALDSPEGDTTLTAEFTLTGSTLTLTNDPADGVKIVIVRKIGKLWYNQGTALRYADTDIARFIRAKTVELPE